jgi:serine/threonine-protein kinase
VGQVDEAVDVFKKLVVKTPTIINGIYTPFISFIREGRGEAMRVAWQQGLEANKRDHGDYDGYPEFCLYLGNENAYREACKMLLANFSTTTDPHVAERTGRALLLLPAPAEQTLVATQLIDRSVQADRSKVEPWAPAYFLFGKSLAEYRQGHYEAAIKLLEGDPGRVLGPCPLLVTAMAQFRLGKISQARQAFIAAIPLFDWSPLHATNKDAWLYHALRREAETVVLPYLPAFEAGNYRPANNDERLTLFGYCQDKSLNVAAARLYVDAFSEDPTLAGSRRGDYRHRAACAAALAGCGQGKDAAALSEADRKQWRTQALAWMQADLNEYSRASGSARGMQIHAALTDWRSDPDLALVRDPAKLQALDPQERERWSALWKMVDTRIDPALDVKK